MLLHLGLYYIFIILKFMLLSLVAFPLDFYQSSLTGKVNLRHYGYGIDEIIHEENNYW